MEELRSIEALSNEIRNDARQRAANIVSKAEESAKALLDGVEKKVSDALAEVQKASDEKIRLCRMNNEASLPLEKERYLVSFIYDSVVNAMNEYFDSIGEDKRLEIIKKLVERSKSILDGKNIKATVIGLDLSKVKKMLNGVFGKSLLSCEKGETYLLEDEAVRGFNYREGILVKTEDGSVSCRLTLDEKVKEILDDNNYEISSTLFKGRLPE